MTKTGKELDVHEYLPTGEMLDKMGKFIESFDLMNVATNDEGLVQKCYIY